MANITIQLAHQRRNQPKRQRGVAMMLVLFAVAIALVLSMGFLTAQGTSTGIAKNLQNQAVARQIAETGLATALAKVKADSDWRTTYTHGTWTSGASFLDGTITIKGEDGTYNSATGAVVGDSSLSNNATDPLTISATGAYNGATFVARGMIATTTTAQQNVLMIVVNASSLTTGEAARKTFLEGKGWMVNVIKESASSGDLDDAMVDAHVVYVPSTITDTGLANTLDDADLGVVCEAGAFNKIFGFASSAGTLTSQTQINLIDNTHYITKSMTVGNTTVTSSSQPLYYIGGTVATGGTVLAKSYGRSNPALFAIEEGALLQGGGTAPARRVALPWGTTAFDYSTLNATGQAILQNALTWAGYFDGSSGASVANRIAVSDSIAMSNTSKIDSFSAATGAYGGTNIGSSASVATNSTTAGKIALSTSASIKGNAYCGVSGTPASVITTADSATISGSKTALTASVNIPTVTAPTMTGSPADVTYSSGTTTLSTDLYCNKLTISGSAILQISGNVVIQAKKTVTVQDTAQIKILSSSTLTLYGKQGINFNNFCQVNVNTAKPSVCTIYSTAGTSKKVVIKDTAKIYATVVAPKNQLRMANSGQLCGTYLGKQLAMIDSSTLSLDATATSIVTGVAGSAYTYSASWVEQP